MMATSRFSIAVSLGAALLVSSCQKNLQAFTEAVRQADRVVLYEGLPHPMFESRLSVEERRNKAIHELNGYSFYQEPLPLTTADAERLSEILGGSGTYGLFSGEKLCGGFHPDYTVEWHVGENRYRALICFGCHEVKLFGPVLALRNDLDQRAYGKLREILQDYRKNRPGREAPMVVTDRAESGAAEEGANNSTVVVSRTTAEPGTSSGRCAPLKC
jgi:hypothetical protein